MLEAGREAIVMGRSVALDARHQLIWALLRFAVGASLAILASPLLLRC